jgi:hypothetical protein
MPSLRDTPSSECNSPVQDETIYLVVASSAVTFDIWGFAVTMPVAAPRLGRLGVLMEVASKGLWGVAPVGAGRSGC